MADALAGRGVPFLFLTGHGPEGIPERFRGRPLLRKPCAVPPLLAALERTAGRRGPGPGDGDGTGPAVGC